MREAGTLVQELVSITTAQGSGRMTVGVEGSGEHDDLTPAVWAGRMGKVGHQLKRLTGM
jgi:hypothetical protein